MEKHWPSRPLQSFQDHSTSWMQLFNLQPFTWGSCRLRRIRRNLSTSRQPASRESSSCAPSGSANSGSYGRSSSTPHFTRRLSRSTSLSDSWSSSAWWSIGPKTCYLSHNLSLSEQIQISRQQHRGRTAGVSPLRGWLSRTTSFDRAKARL